MNELTVLDSISVAKIENIFWTNGSRLKPNKVVPEDRFKIINGIRPVWINQEIVGWILLEGEYNYAIYNGTYYFLSKTTVADQGTAWIYTLTKDYWANWLSRGVRLKGDVNRTDDRNLILNYLDHVVPLVPDPCELVRVPFDNPDEHWSSDIKVIRPDTSLVNQRYYTKDDWSRFWSQAKNAVTPNTIKKDQLKHPIIVAQLKATGKAEYKIKALQALERMLENLTDYYFGKVTALKNSYFTYRTCLTTTGKFGVRESSLTNRKEYYKISKLDFSGLTDIQPVKTTGINVAYKNINIPLEPDEPSSFTKDIWTYKPLEKIYREVCPRYYLPIFKYNVPFYDDYKNLYKGRLAQYVRLPNNPSPRAFLYAIPDSYGYLAYENHKIKFKRLEKYIYYHTGILLAPVPYDGIHYCHPDYENLCPALTRLNEIKILSRVIPKLNLRDSECSQDLSPYSKDTQWGKYMDCRNPMRWKYWSSASTDSEVAAKKLDPMGQWNYDALAFQYKPVKSPFVFHPGSYFWTTLSGYVRETDEYDATTKFLNYGVGYPDQETKEVDLEEGLVIAYCGRGTAGFRFMIVEKKPFDVTLWEDTDRNQSYLALGFPKYSDDVDIKTYDEADINVKRPYPQDLYHLKPLGDWVGHDTETFRKVPEREEWIKQLNKEKAKKAMLYDLLKIGIVYSAHWRVDAVSGAYGSTGLYSTYYIGREREQYWRDGTYKPYYTGERAAKLETQLRTLFGTANPTQYRPVFMDDLSDSFLYDLVWNGVFITRGDDEIGYRTAGGLYWSTTRMDINPNLCLTCIAVAHPIISTGKTASDYLTNVGFYIPKLNKYLYVPWAAMKLVENLDAVSPDYDPGWVHKSLFYEEPFSAQDWIYYLSSNIESLKRFTTFKTPYIRERIEDMVPFIEHPKLQINFYHAIGKGYLEDIERSTGNFVFEDKISDFYEAGGVKIYDLVGTDYWLVLDINDKAHLIFKSGADIDSSFKESYEITQKKIPQSFVDVVSNRNILRVYNTDFDLNERIKWEDPSWRGNTPTIKIKRYAPLDKLSALDTYYVSYQGIKVNIESPIQVPKEELPSVEVDHIQIDQLNLDLQKWNASYLEKRKFKEEELQRQIEKHQERRELQNIKWQEASLNVAKLTTSSIGKIGSALMPGVNGRWGLGNVVSGAAALAEIGINVTEHIFNRQKLGIETEAMNKDIALEVSKMALTKFQLDHEHHWKHKEYKFAMAKLGVVYTEASVNERSIIEQYVEEYQLNSPIYLKHYKPSTLQRELAETIFKNFGCECLIDGITMEIKDGMKPGIWGFVEVLEHFSIFEEVERTLCSELLKNGVKIQEWSEEIKEPIDPVIEEQSWIEKLDSLISMRNEETKDHLVRTLFRHLEENRALRIIGDMYGSSPNFLSDLSKQIQNADAFIKFLSPRVSDQTMQEILKTRSGMTLFDRKQLEDRLKVVEDEKVRQIAQIKQQWQSEVLQVRAESAKQIDEAKKIAENEISIAKADAGKQVADAESKKKIFEELAKSQTTKLNEEIAAKTDALTKLDKTTKELTKVKEDFEKEKDKNSRMWGLPKRVLELYKPIFDSIETILTKTQVNQRFGLEYGIRDVASLKIKNYLYEPKKERAGWGSSPKYDAYFYGTAASATDSLKPAFMRKDILELNRAKLNRDQTSIQINQAFGIPARSKKDSNVMIDPTRNLIYPDGGDLGTVPVLINDQIENLQVRDSTLYWDTHAGKFHWASGRQDTSRYIAIKTNSDWDKLLTGEIFGIEPRTAKK